MRPAFHRQCLIAVLGIVAALISAPVSAARPDTEVPLSTRGTVAWYVPGHIEGLGDTEFMVDTGSGYMTINERTLERLLEAGAARFERRLTGMMADGSRRSVPVYRLSSVRIGADCELHDVEAAVFPGSTRHILGLNALSRTAPFTFAMDPPRLILGACGLAS